MKIVYVVAGLLPLTLASGCMSTQLKYDTEMRAYVECNARNVRRFALQNGDAYTLAIAAEAQCGRQFADLLDTIRAQRDAGQALRLGGTIKQAAIESNVGDIASLRAR